MLLFCKCTQTLFLSICLHSHLPSAASLIMFATYMYTSCIQFSFHVCNHINIIYTALCTQHSASFSGTWTHVTPCSEITSDVHLQSPMVTWHIWRFPVLCPSWLEMRGTSQPKEREKGMTLTRPNTSVAVWGMLPWRWGEGYFSLSHGAGPSVHRHSVHMPNWDTPTHPRQSSRQ